MSNSQKPVSVGTISVQVRPNRKLVGRVGSRTVQSRSRGVITRVFKDGYAYIQDSEYPRQFVVTYKELSPSTGRSQQFKSIRDGVRVQFTESRGRVNNFEVIS